MKVLITGAESYIGESVANYISKKEPSWRIKQLDVRGDYWHSFSFREYDVVYHVAGIAHRRITKEVEPLYFSVNRDLAEEVAKKAKNEGIRQFIFMSSMSVYSDSTSYVDFDTPTQPDNVYGESKLQAEKRITVLESDTFKVAVIRPPMIYGKGCKGNYNSLRKIALQSPVFPLVKNRRSMLYIDNLSEFVYQLILCGRGGVYFPQNQELANTSEWAKSIAVENGKSLHLSRFLGLCTTVGKHIPIMSKFCIKAFGDSYYSLEMSKYDDIKYQVVSFRDSIHYTEK